MMYASSKDFLKSHMEGLAVELQVKLSATSGPPPPLSFLVCPATSAGLAALIQVVQPQKPPVRVRVWDVLVAQVSDKDEISEADIHEHVLSVLTRK